MQNAKSSVTYLVILGFDVIKFIVAYRHMKHQLSDVDRMRTQHSPAEFALLQTVLAAFKEPGVIDQDPAIIRKKSSVLLRTVRPIAGQQPGLCITP